MKSVGGNGRLPRGILGGLLAVIVPSGVMYGEVAWAQGTTTKPPRKIRGDAPPNAASPVNMVAMRLLRRMVVAELTLPYAAREATIRADGPGAEHIVKSDPHHGVRREPVKGKGTIMLDDFHQVYRFPSTGKGKVTVEESRQTRQMAKKVQDITRRLRTGSLRADIVGQDTIAGRVADIVLVSAPNEPGGVTRRFWIDRDTGLRLRTEETDSAGKVLSGSYYQSLDLTPQFGASDFTPPDGTAQPAPLPRQMLPDRRRFKTIEEATRAGFAIAAPTYVPSGYALRQVETVQDGNHIALRYANGLSALSITLLREGVPPRVRPFLRSDNTAFVPFPQGRNGLFIGGAGNSNTYLLIGDLPESELRRIASSLH